MKRLIKDDRKYKLSEPRTAFGGYGFRENIYAEKQVEKNGNEYIAHFCGFIDIPEHRDFQSKLRSEGIERAVQSILPGVRKITQHHVSKGQYDIGSLVRISGVIEITEEEFDGIIADERHDRDLEEKLTPLKKDRAEVQKQVDALTTKLNALDQEIYSIEKNKRRDSKPII